MRYRIHTKHQRTANAVVPHLDLHDEVKVNGHTGRVTALKDLHHVIPVLGDYTQAEKKALRVRRHSGICRREATITFPDGKTVTAMTEGRHGWFCQWWKQPEWKPAYEWKAPAEQLMTEAQKAVLIAKAEAQAMEMEQVERRAVTYDDSDWFERQRAWRRAMKEREARQPRELPWFLREDDEAV